MKLRGFREDRDTALKDNLEMAISYIDEKQYVLARKVLKVLTTQLNNQCKCLDYQPEIGIELLGTGKCLICKKNIIL